MIEHLFGVELIKDGNKLAFDTAANPRCKINGKDLNGNPFTLPLDDTLFSKHLLFLGNIGTGKTNAISQVVSQIKNQLTENDLMIVFDTKGDFYSQFFKDGDIVISNNSAKFKGANEYWNIFSETTIDNTLQSITENSLEIANNLFADKIKSSSSPFFPQAAKDVLATFLKVIATRYTKDAQNNEELIGYFESSGREKLQQFFEINQQTRINSYISKDAASQADGVISELNQLLGEIFIGDFRKKGNLSIRDLVRNKGGKTIFLEYDISVGNVLTPIYRLMFDLAIKETLSSSQREAPKGNVWFFIDEFSLLPNLKYLDNGVNFGRSQGAKFIIGVQNIPQVYHEYGEDLGQSLLSGIRTVFSFHIDDIKSREFIQNRYGFAQKKLTYSDSFGTAVDNVQSMKVIEDWDISNLKTGSAIVGLPDGNPFVFQFGEYQK
ncbi:MAG: type IV secretion system DNA-binding domain-containing protein [Melioribacteraceae bacterium]|nr:type IV secretion system DNA-binding domain-containing protein [Chitinophagaceae bacterium]MBX3009830.1 type IV secretion system DNA-binding domain-containing protein [Melioribacteraceae bacterium]